MSNQSDVHLQVTTRALTARLPVLANERIYTNYSSLMWTFLAFNAATWAYLIGGALPFIGNTKIGLAGFFAGAVIGLVPVTLASGMPSLRYGVDTIEAAKAPLRHPWNSPTTSGIDSYASGLVVRRDRTDSPGSRQRDSGYREQQEFAESSTHGGRSRRSTGYLAGRRPGTMAIRTDIKLRCARALGARGRDGRSTPGQVPAQYHPQHERTG